MKSLISLDKKTIAGIITSDFPQFEIKSIKLIENGWDNIVAEINSQYIFRFLKNLGESKYRNIGKDFNREIKLLNYLQGKTSLAIPNIEFIGKTITYTGYKKIPGGDLTNKVYSSLTKRQKDKLIFDLANFLREIHDSLSIKQAGKMGFISEDLRSYSKMVKRILPKKITNPKIQRFIKETCTEYDSMIKVNTKSVFLYNDLHTENMAFDYKGKRLNGIFDFSDVMIGDINMDFYPLYKFDPYLMKAVVEKYQFLTGLRLNLRRMVIYGRINEICDLAEFINQPESRIYKKVMRYIQKWEKEMDIFK